MFEQIEIFSSLDKKELETLSLFCQERFLEKDELLFSYNDDANAMYFLKSGKLEAILNDRVLGIINPGEFVGEMAIFGENKKRSASVKALENSNLIVFLDFSIKDLSNKYPNILKKIKEIIKKRIDINKN